MFEALPFLNKKSIKTRVTCIDFQIRIRGGHGPVTCTRNLTFSPKKDGLRLNAAIYLTWAAKYLQFSKAKTQENFLKIA